MAVRVTVSMQINASEAGGWIMNNGRIGWWLLAAGLALLTAGCGTTQPTRFYQLTPQAEPPADQQPLSDLAIGVGPVRLADYLGRPQIVQRENENKLKVEEFDRWGGSLETNVAWVVAENLSTLLGTQSAITFPWERAVIPDYQVIINVRRLDSGDGSQVQLVGLWQIINAQGRGLLSINRSAISEPVTDASVDALVAAQSRALARMSGRIAAAIREHHSR